MRGDLDMVLRPGLSGARSFAGAVDEDLARWRRLAELSGDGQGRLRGEVKFDSPGDGSALLRADLELEAALVCQRCLEPLTLRIPVRVRIALGEETGAPEEFEAYGQVEGSTLRQLLEDELLLEVPSFPVHREIDECGASAQMIERLAPEESGHETTQNPFAALASLKRKK